MTDRSDLAIEKIRSMPDSLKVGRVILIDEELKKPAQLKRKTAEHRERIGTREYCAGGYEAETFFFSVHL